MLLAIKYNEDEYYSNVYYAQVGGISLTDVNNMEALFLKSMDFELFVDCQDYEKYMEHLSRYDS